MSGTHARPLPLDTVIPEGTNPVDVQQALTDLRQSVEQARAMPMSSSCVINRAEVLSLVDRLEQSITQALSESTRVGAERDEIIRRATDEAEQIVAQAESRRDDLVSDSEVFRLASSKAERMVEEATEEAQMLRRDADDYVEGRLAALETSLQSTLEAVSRGRSRLRGRNPLEELGRHDDEVLPDPDH
jgi:hypothetical protein